MDVEQIQDDDLSGVTSIQVQNRVNALLKLNDTHGQLSEEMMKEIRAIEAKYEALFLPLYNKRTAIVSGQVEPTGDDLACEEPIAVEGLTAGTEKGIPDFWHRILMQHPIFQQMIQEVDEEALSHLIDINVVESGNVSFTVNFVFSANPLFTNSTISMALAVNTESENLESITVSPIEWKEGKNFTVETVEKSIKKKGPKGKKPATTTKKVEQKVDCFFGTFFTNASPSEEADEDDEENMGMQNMYAQYQGLVTLKDTIVPTAVEWFLGRGEVEEDDEDMYGGEGMEFDEEDEDDDEEDVPQLKSAGKKGGNGGAPNQPPQQECKQQ
eukprot:gene19053-22810_t